MPQPTTLEEAAKKQRAIHARIDAGENFPEREWRAASLKEGYEYRQALWYGTGTYSVRIDTGEVCEFDGVWVGDDILLCKNCFEDGT